MFIAAAGSATAALVIAVVPTHAAQSTGAARDVVTIRVGTWESGAAVALDQQIANNYMKTHPGVKIQIESVPDNYGTKILTEVAAGDAPDIFQIGDGDVAMFRSKGAITNLTPYVKSSGFNLNQYYPNVLDIGKVNGILYTMPKDWSDLAIYYNKKLFDQAHLAYPKPGWTWQQFYADAKKLTVVQNGKTTQWGVNLPGAWTRAVYPFVNAFGGSLANKTADKFQGYMNSAGTVAGMKFYQQLYQSHVAPSSADAAAFQGVDLFQVGRVAMNMTGIWPNQSYATTPGLSYGAVPLPVGPAGAANTICYSGFGLYSKSAHKDQAWEYLKYLAGPQGETILTKSAFASIKSVAIAAGQMKDPVQRAFTSDVPNIKPLPEVISPYFNNSGGKVFGDFLNQMMLGKPLDIQQQLNAGATQATQLYAQAKVQQ